jgi:hypothetical protein
MLPILFKTRKRIFRHYTGFSFFVFIWISALETDPARLIRHEKIHFLQQLELFFVFHWLLYGLFYLISRIKRQGHYIAYRYNPFEVEAYTHDTDVNYLMRRRPYAWTRYLRDFLRTLNTNMSGQVPKHKEIRW